MTSETETEYEATKICTTTGLTLPSVLYVGVRTYLGDVRGETVELNHAAGESCDTWAGTSRMAGQIELCHDEDGWVMFGGGIVHPIRFTVVSEVDLLLLMGAGMVRNPAGRGHLHVVAEVSC